MNSYVLRFLIFVMALLYIFVIPDNPLYVKLFFKAIPILLIIYYAIRQSKRVAREVIHYLVVIGLIFSLVGDVTLQWFLIGLSAFLLGHILYVAGFLTKWRFSMPLSLAIIPIGLFGWWMGSNLLEALRENGEETLMVPVVVYITVISLMCFLAVMTRNKWAVLGGVLFVISDAILAWNMFIEPVAYEGIIVMGTYYAGQFFIAHSLYQFGVEGVPFTRRTD